MKSFAFMVIAGTLAAGATAVLSAPAKASTVTVVLPSQSIQAAVNAASPGDTIQLMPGIYRQSVTITTNDITLQGAGSGPDGTVLMPPATLPDNFCAKVPPGPPPNGGGICVFGSFNSTTGDITSVVTGVRITGIRLADWPGDGLAAFATAHLRIDHLTVEDSGQYGLSVLASTYGLVDHNTVTGIQTGDGAGIFLGIMPNSHVIATGNDVSDAGLGVRLYDVGDLTFTGNTSHGNCEGAAVIDDNQPQDGLPADYGNILITGNQFSGNNAVCPADSAVGQPLTQGGGLVMIGTPGVVVSANTITGNTGQTSYSGGILVFRGASDERDDTIVGNTVLGNQPDDLIWDQQGSGIDFTANDCRTSSPAGLCGSAAATAGL